MLQEGLRRLREELGYTQTDLANALHVGYATVNRWENGKVVPNLYTATAVMEIIRKMDVSKSCIDYLEKSFFPEEDDSLNSIRRVDISLANTIIEETANGVFVCDPDTYELLYMNQMIKNHGHPGVKYEPGMTCYKYLFNYDEPCPGCLEQKLSQDCVHEHEYITKDGNHYIVKGKLTDWEGKRARIEYVVNDTESRKQSLHEDLANRIPGGIGIYYLYPDDSLELEYLNDGFYATLRETREERTKYLGKGALEAIHPEDQTKLMKEIHASIDGNRSGNLDLRIRRKNGEYRWYNAKITVADKFGGRITLYFLYTDIHVFKMKHHKEMELIEKQKIIEAKSKFMSAMSHDLRTPLNIIWGIAELTKDVANDPEEVKKNMEEICTTSIFMTELINDLLEMKKLQEGAVQLNKSRYEYTAFVANLKRIFRAFSGEKKLNFQMKEASFDVDIDVDKVRLNQVFFNVLSNAVKFTPEGGTITFGVNNPVIDQGRLYCDFVITDTGIGMSKEFQTHLFEPFVKEESAITSELTSSGLGLCMTKKLVELMGGSIAITSEQGVGTEVTIHMSFDILSDDAQMDQIKQLEQANVLEGKHVLLAEDHPLNSKIAKALLERKNMQVTTAENGQIAIDVFNASKPGTFDLILMDIRMPVMDGVEAAREIRRLKRKDAKHIPIIALSANAFDEDVQSCLRAGMNTHLSKPIDPKAMYEVLAEYVK